MENAERRDDMTKECHSKDGHRAGIIHPIREVVTLLVELTTVEDGEAEYK